jgi:hypothetical protein
MIGESQDRAWPAGTQNILCLLLGSERQGSQPDPNSPHIPGNHQTQLSGNYFFVELFLE